VAPRSLLQAQGAMNALRGAQNHWFRWLEAAYDADARAYREQSPRILHFSSPQGTP